MPRGLAMLLAAVLAGAAPPAAAQSVADTAALDALLAQAYAPYRQPGGPRQPYYDRPIYATQTRALIQTWRQFTRQADAVSEVDRLCACQDHDPAAFRYEVMVRQFTGPGRAVMRLRLWPMAGAASEVRIQALREGGRWWIDDIADVGNGPAQGGLQAALRQMIAATAHR